jgi:phenylpyruvate tautomerase PptA (4-oxalocrotonate tautomerase family)
MRMPILRVEIVFPRGRAARPGLAKAIADAAGATLNSPSGQTWVRLHELAEENYAENGVAPHPEELPVFVHLLKAVTLLEEDLATEALDLTAAIAGACGRSVESVHLIYEPPAAGRVAFGGRLVRSVRK